VSHDLQLFLGPADMEVVIPGKLGNLSLTLRDWVIYHQPHIRWGDLGFGLVRAGLVIFYALGGGVGQ
jgi:hypothetical protein